MSIVRLIFIGLLVLVATGVFAIRLQHPGPYSMPLGGALIGAIASFGLAGLLYFVRQPKWLAWIAIAMSPIAMFPALYSIMGESEEVISLFAKNTEGHDVDLRLWIVDRDDGAWVGMGRGKAIEHSLDGAKLQMLRAGKLVCVQPVLFEDRPTVKTIHGMKVGKYRVAQVSGAMGFYPLEAPDTTVVLRLDACEG